ncbi:MAG: hypothetical protein AAF415_10855, partial [Pseudomonadota bacterium]
LLCKNAKQRQLNMASVKDHAWFTDAHFNWDKLEQQQMQAPFEPEIYEKDTSSFEFCDDLSPVKSYHGRPVARGWQRGRWRRLCRGCVLQL